MTAAFTPAPGGSNVRRRVITCPACGTENSAGRKFCGGCGQPLALTCAACGAANEPDMRFCGQCGSPLDAAAPERPPAAAPAAERRLVSVLFADLVGFTTLSESRDAEEVRELLSHYFDSCRSLIGRYGGTVEKFIGDAVMAVWGTPVATEDDAERAVRAGLDLVASVAALGDEFGAPGLAARVGVLTGEAAVTLGAEGEGMVAGDLVNTASRIQSAAEPGTVLVGEATRRTSEAAIAYADAGSHELKGKAEPVQLWRASRVVSGRQGALKSAGLEAPFVGRERELRQLKELFHACADEKKPHLVSVTGIAGIGKSRLGWEFYKYFDGLADTIYWHRGRCLAYGEGVTYWALADMIRMRCLIAEDEDDASAAAKLHATVEEHLRDPADRTFVEPRLAQLLALGDHKPGEQQDLFAAWRLFFERLAETYPTVLAFEDLQWADASLLDFVEYLIEWSRGHPIFVLTLARPELADRRPSWGAGHRHFSSMYLEPLGEAAMEELLTGLVPGLPEEIRAQVLARAEGVPLYAVETVRMLIDRGALVAGRRRLPAGRPDRVARRPGDAARIDRGPPRRARAPGAPAAPGRVRARQDLHRRGTCGHLGHGAAGRAAADARAQGDPRAPDRPPLARARTVRLPPGPRPPRRLRDALPARAARPAPRSGRVRRGRVPRRERGRRGGRRALPGRLRCGARCRRRRRREGEGARCARARGRPSRLPRCGGRGDALS